LGEAHARTLCRRISRNHCHLASAMILALTKPAVAID
jgi:hypothetical protein